MKIKKQNRSGLLQEHHGIAPLIREARATIPVVEVLRAAGATVEPLAIGYHITLGAIMPAHIVAVHLNSTPYIGLRMENEPEYPQEYPDYWQQVDWTPCPQCAAPLVWYEAGYVPGYRVCSRPPHHHSLVS